MNNPSNLQTPKPLNGRYALVTGGSRGIGRAIVKRLADEGAAVTFTYAGDSESAQSAAREISTSTGAEVRAVRADLGTPATLVSAFDEAVDADGFLDIVVHNAAVDNGTAPIADSTDEDFDFVIGGNVGGGFAVVREASRRVRDGGRIVAISSLDTVLPGAGNSLYAGSKAAVEQFTLIASKELGLRGITANVVSPGAVDTSRLRSAKLAQELGRAAAAASLNRLGQPDDIANVVAFLVGPDGGWMTGQNLRASGGIF